MVWHRKGYVGLVALVVGWLLFGHYFSAGQAPQSMVLKIKTAFDAGDAEVLSGYFGDLIDLKINGLKTNYSRNQARFILRRFFHDHPPGRFALKEQTPSDQPLQHLIAHFRSQRGEAFEVYLMLISQGGRHEVKSVRIDRIN